MAANQTQNHDTKFPLPVEHSRQMTLNLEENQEFDYSNRSQWLHAAVLGANDGLVSTVSLMMVVGAVKEDINAMILTGFAGPVAGACSMTIGEFVSVYSHLEIELAQMRRDRKRAEAGVAQEVDQENNESAKSNAGCCCISSGVFRGGDGPVVMPRAQARACPTAQ